MAILAPFLVDLGPRLAQDGPQMAQDDPKDDDDEDNDDDNDDDDDDDENVTRGARRFYNTSYARAPKTAETTAIRISGLTPKGFIPP